MTKPMTVGLSLLALVATFGVTAAAAQTLAADEEPRNVIAARAGRSRQQDCCSNHQVQRHTLS